MGFKYFIKYIFFDESILFFVVLFFKRNVIYFDKFFVDDYKFLVGENLFNLN